MTERVYSIESEPDRETQNPGGRRLKLAKGVRRLELAYRFRTSQTHPNGSRCKAQLHRLLARQTERQLATRILGIDPGLNVTGYGVIDVLGRQIELVEGGVVRSSRTRSLEFRLDQIYSGVVDIIQSLKPDRMSLEEVFSHYARPKTAILMGHARGVINLAAARNNLSVQSYLPNQVKRIMTGSGHAPKSQIQWAVARHFNLSEPPTPHDVADALAIALCDAFIQQNQLTNELNQLRNNLS